MYDFKGFMDGDQMLIRYSFDRPKVTTPEVKIEKIDTEVFTNLGYCNGWGGELPLVYKACREQKHILNTEHLHRGVEKYSCPICQYTYKADSTD